MLTSVLDRAAVTLGTLSDNCVLECTEMLAGIHEDDGANEMAPFRFVWIRYRITCLSRERCCTQ